MCCGSVVLLRTSRRWSTTRDASVPSTMWKLGLAKSNMLFRALGFGTKPDIRPVAVYDHEKLVEILAAEFAKDDARDGEEREDGD